MIHVEVLLDHKKILLLELVALLHGAKRAGPGGAGRNRRAQRVLVRGPL